MARTNIEHSNYRRPRKDNINMIWCFFGVFILILTADQSQKASCSKSSRKRGFKLCRFDTEASAVCPAIGFITKLMLAGEWLKELVVQVTSISILFSVHPCDHGSGASISILYGRSKPNVARKLASSGKFTSCRTCWLANSCKLIRIWENLENLSHETC